MQRIELWMSLFAGASGGLLGVMEGRRIRGESHPTETFSAAEVVDRVHFSTVLQARHADQAIARYDAGQHLLGPSDRRRWLLRQHHESFLDPCQCGRSVRWGLDRTERTADR